MRWIELEERDFADTAAPHQEEVRGIVLEVRVSPFSLPEAVKGTYDPESRLFEIRFRYLDGEEDAQLCQTHGHVRVFEGRNSGRIMRIEVDVDALGVEAVQLALKAIEQREQHASRQQRPNFGAALEALRSREQDLVAPAAG